GQLLNAELRFAFGIVEFPAITRVVRQIKNIFANPRVEILESRNHALNAIADPIVIREAVPTNRRTRAESRLCQTGNDCWFAEKMLTGGLTVSAGRIDDSHRIFDGHKLFA